MGDVLAFVKPDELPEPPEHLSEEAKGIWAEIHGRWVLDVDGALLLRAALESWDEYQRAREVLAREGPTTTNASGNVRQHPASLVARDALKSFRLLLKDLNLDPDEVVR